MMNGFNKVSYKQRKFVMEFVKPEPSAQEETQETQYETIKTSDIVFTATSLSRNGFSLVKAYDAAGSRYFYCNNKYIEKIVNNVFRGMSFYSDKPPVILPVVHNGETKVLVVGKYNDQVNATVGDTSVSGVPFGTAYAVVAGRLFIGDKSRLNFSKPFDFTEFSHELGSGGFIDLDADDGDIIYLAEAQGVLYVFCKHCIYKLSPLGEEYDFTLKKISTCYLNIREKSVCECFDTVYFASDDAIFAFSGDKVKQVGEGLKFLTFTNGYAGVADGIYILPVTLSGANKIYIYDGASGTEKLKDANGYTLCGNYAYKSADNVIYRIGRTVVEETVAIETAGVTSGESGSAQTTEETDLFDGDYDLGTCLKKAVTGVEAHVAGSATMNIEGEGFKTVTLTGACNAFTCFLHGKNFHITFTNRSQDFFISKLTIKFITYGDDL